VYTSSDTKNNSIV